MISNKPTSLTKGSPIRSRTAVQGFEPVARQDAEVLIVGSFPGVRSLEAGEYYAFERNRFWEVLHRVLRTPDSGRYRDRLMAFRRHRVALWDVLKSCERPGSLDTRIERSTESSNDFNSFFRQHRSIKAVFFNGHRRSSSSIGS
jgi:TDG/mug DNA glycosylase family protein